MKQLVLTFAFLLATATANGGEPFPRSGNSLDSGYRAPMEIDRLAALLGDEALRDMVCRLSHERYAFGNLSSALGMPEGQVMRRINTLRGWGLGRMVRHDSAHTIVEPMPGDGGQTLRRWAKRYCSEGDACGVPAANPGAPATNPDNQTTERKEAAVGDGVVAPPGGGASSPGEKKKALRGTVKWFNANKGFGFIEREDGSSDVYVHRSAVERSGLRYLKEGQKVIFDLVPGRGGKMAADNLSTES